MHYYKRNLGDYAKKAGRLSMLQHGAYTLLIDACYDREQFPTLEDAIEWTWASTTEEIEAVTFVLRKFFTLVDGVYVQKRIQEEVDDYRTKAETNKRIADEREANRKRIVNESCEKQNEPPPNHKPITNNQEPLTTNQEPQTNIQSPLAFGSVTPPDASLSVVAPKKPVGEKKEKESTALQQACREVWTAYSQAYSLRYAVKPVRNDKVNSLVKQLVKRLGQEAAEVAVFYVGHQNAYYVRTCHSLDSLVKDCEALRTQWLSGNRITNTKANEADRLQATGDGWQKLINEEEAKERALHVG